MPRNEVIDRDFGYDDLITDLDALSSMSEGPDVFVGFRAESIGADLVRKAAANEFGTETNPERSFLRTTVDENSRVYLDELETATGEFVDGNTGRAEQTLLALGVRVVGDVREKIEAIKTPPNAASTIAAKGTSNPLIEDGNMRQAVESIVVIDGEVLS